jgi:uncharacterized phage protein (TIGR02218 family)
MIAIPVPCVEFRLATIKRWATCWRIARVDTALPILRFTSHDRILTVAGESYTPVGSFDASARRREGALRHDAADAHGIISSSAITAEDLRAGRYREAAVIERLVDWRYPFAGTILAFSYWIDDTTFDGERWTANISGLARFLDHRVGDTFARTCRWDLGDANCAVALGPFTTSGVHVLGMVDGARRRIIRANASELSGVHPDGWFAWGKVTLTSGANNGIVRVVKAYTQATREIEVQDPFPFEIAIGDTFSVSAGCNKLYSTCKNKFANLARFGGYPTIPGVDKVLRTVPG